VDARPLLKKDWVLTKDAFDRLLRRLDSDPERAGQKYEHVRRGLITFFECRGSPFPEDHADETINRVARRLLEGKEIHVENPAGYFYGVARNVLKESWESARQAPLESVPSAQLVSDDPSRLGDRQLESRHEERRLDCLERCLQTLAQPDRDLIGEYYQGETSVKIQNRRLLAERLAIPLNALRIRALRIRERLEACVERCTGQPAEK
jgi:DNA-directed RNA polymerase specialized sigma24 family protein